MEASRSTEPIDARLRAIREREPRRVIGLLSGTSADGVDAALVRLGGSGGATRIETVAHLVVPYPPSLRQRVLRAPDLTIEEAADLSLEIGEAFAQTAEAVAAAAGLSRGEIDLVGSHGQTIFHRARRDGRPAATVQIGDAAPIAHRTGAVVVSDFRSADVAVGGEGAPLVPILDRLVFGGLGRAVVALNLGGIANVTLVRGPDAPVVAFDTGPANALLDAVARRELGAAFDRDGREAAAGSADAELLRRLLAHPYLESRPPKSTGRETFGDRLLDDVRREHPTMRTADLLATLTAFTVESIVRAIERFVAPVAAPTEVIASGGGVHNRTLVDALRARLDPIPVTSSAAHGIDPDSKEAILFAVLANETVHGRPGNLPEATGASRPVVLGRITV
jgi:anhydro-N-acetylmuramic acid kinase